MNGRRDQSFAAQALDALPRRVSADCLIDGRAQAVDVSGGSERAAADLLFGSRVAHIDGLPDYVVLHAASQVGGVAPVNETDAPISAQKAVDGADIAVDVAAGVDLVQDLQRSLHDVKRQGKGKTAAEAVHIFLAGHALKVFFDQIEGPVLLKRLNQVGDAGDIAEEVEHLRFPAHLHQAAGELLLFGERGRVGNRLRLGLTGDVVGVDAQRGGETVHVFRREFFDGNFPAGNLIFSKIDRAESTGTQYGPQAVTVMKKV